MKWIYLGIAIPGLLACGSDDNPGAPGDVCQVEAKAPESLQWKRTHAFTHDLMAALELDESQVCSELGDVPCTELHRFALGSSDPVNNTIYVAPAQPSIITPLVMDRVALAACSNRVALEAAGSENTVFGAIDLGAATLDPESAAVKDQIRVLYRRLLQREGTENEVAILAELAGHDDVSGQIFATLACFSIATTSEFLFF